MRKSAEAVIPRLRLRRASEQSPLIDHAAVRGAIHEAVKEGVGGACPMLDHDASGLVFLRLVRKLVAKDHAQPVALAFDTLQAPVELRLDAELVSAPPPDDLLGIGHFHREMAVETKERDSLRPLA